MPNYPATLAGFRKLSNGLVAMLDRDGNTIDVVTEDEADEIGDAIEAEEYADY